MAEQYRAAALELIGELTHCPEVAHARNQSSHPCSRVVGVQAADPARFQVPEPWAGHLHLAPLLLISSNPSISEDEPYPTWDQPEEVRRRFFDERFGEGSTQVRNGVHFPLKQPGPDGSWHSRHKVPFWRDCKANVSFVLGRDADPGVDYAMTEVVHCKSRAERGVRQATGRCVDRWLERVVALSPASVVAVLGSVAIDAVSEHIGVQLPMWKLTAAVIGGRERLVLAARHPNFHGVRAWRDCLDDATLAGIHDALSGPSTVGGNLPFIKPTGAAASGHRVSMSIDPAVSDAIRRMFNSPAGGEVDLDVLPDGGVILVATATGRVFARADHSSLTLLLAQGDAEREHARHGGRLHEVADDAGARLLLLPSEQLTEPGAEDRLMILLLRAMYRAAPDAGSSPVLTVDDLVAALQEEYRFRDGPPDMREYWTRRLQTMSALFGVEGKLAAESAKDGVGIQLLLDTVLGKLASNPNPFAGLYEVPPEWLPVMNAHNETFGDIESRRQRQGHQVLHDILLMVDPDLAERTVHRDQLAAEGVPYEPPRDELALIMDGEFDP